METQFEPYLKLDPSGIKCMAQQTYEPLVSKDGKTFCKNYNFPNEYAYRDQKDRPLYTEDVVDWFFQNELRRQTERNIPTKFRPRGKKSRRRKLKRARVGKTLDGSREASKASKLCW